MNPYLNITILEKSSRLLSKVKISGGGRCNVTHHCFDVVEISKRYPRGRHFVKKAFHRFFVKDIIEWFESRGVKLKAEKDGRMFPLSDTSQSVINCLLQEADKYGVQIKMHAEVRSVQLVPASKEGEKELVHDEKVTNRFVVELADTKIMFADYVCVACGGYPKSAMFEWIKKLGHSIEEPVPSLFTFNIPDHPLTKLMGVSVEKAVIKIAGTGLKEEGPLLITHWGMSGPVVLRLSAWGARELAGHHWHFLIHVNWLPAYQEPLLRTEFIRCRKELAGHKIGTHNPFGLPQRLWDYFLQQSETDANIRWADLPAARQNKLIKNLCDSEFHVKGKTTYKEEFVTAGGVRLGEIDPNTMMSKKTDNLFFAGEIMDVDGITGGFNFQHAWTSGFIAAATIAAKSAS